MFVIEPLTLVFFDFEIEMNTKACMIIQNSIPKKLNVDLDSLATSFNESPLTLGCDLIYKEDTSCDNYASVTTIESVFWRF